MAPEVILDSSIKLISFMLTVFASFAWVWALKTRTRPALLISFGIFMVPFTFFLVTGVLAFERIAASEITFVVGCVMLFLSLIAYVAYLYATWPQGSAQTGTSTESGPEDAPKS